MIMYLIYESKLLNYRFREPHPMKPERYLLTYELIKSYGLIDARISVVKPKLFEEKILLLAHDEEYVDFVKSMSKLGEGYLDYGDTPAFKGCFEAALLHVSSTLTAVDIAFNRGIVSVNLAGGYHHAKRLSAGGFCIFNDIAIAVNYLADKYGVRRIAVVDFDVHHGDGTQELLYDKDVLKIDIHENGRYLYPGTGFVSELGEGDGYGYMVNIPMPPHSSDDDYILVFEEVIIPLLKWYKPEFLLCQCGVDAHYTDPLAHMELTSKAYKYMSKRLSEISSLYCKNKCVLLGGGGYNLSSVPRMWLVIMSSFLNLELSDKLPRNWIELFREIMGLEGPRSLYDKLEAREIPSVKRSVREVVTKVKETLREIHGPVI